MKFAILTFLVTVLCGQVQGQNPTQSKKCPPNSDVRYDRRTVLENIAMVLTESLPERRQTIRGRRRLRVDEGDRAVGFFISDLTDPQNHELTMNQCIELKNGHFYHAAPIRSDISFSHIFHLEDGRSTVFRSINCPGSDDSLDAVLAFADKKLDGTIGKGEVIDRLRKYRRYGVYSAVDQVAVKCSAAK